MFNRNVEKLLCRIDIALTLQSDSSFKNLQFALLLHSKSFAMHVSSSQSYSSTPHSVNRKKKKKNEQTKVEVAYSSKRVWLEIINKRINGAKTKQKRPVHK